MKDDRPMTSDPSSEIRSLAAGIRIMSGAFTLTVCYLNIRLTCTIPHFSAIYYDMLGGKALPWLTSTISWLQPLLLVVSLGLPLVSIMALWKLPSHKKALSVTACVLVASLLQLHLTWMGMYAPLSLIMRGLTSSEP